MTTPAESTDDRALFDRLRAGDQSAFDAIFREWYAPLVRLSFGLLRDKAAAEDVVQDVMLELWRRREELALETSAKAYLYRSTRNRSLNHLRHAKVQREKAPYIALDDERPASAPTELIAEEIDAAVKEAVASLPPRTREVFEMSRVHGLKYSEIAEALEISVKAVEGNMARALRILRERLARFLPNGDSL